MLVRMDKHALFQFMLWSVWVGANSAYLQRALSLLLEELAQDTDSFSSAETAMRAIQTLLFSLQTVNVSLGAHAKLKAALGGNSGQLQADCSMMIVERHFHISQLLLVAYHLTMSYFPLIGCHSLSDPCKPPINYFDNQFTLHLGFLMAGISPHAVLQSSLFTTHSLPLPGLEICDHKRRSCQWTFRLLHPFIALPLL